MLADNTKVSHDKDNSHRKPPQNARHPTFTVPNNLHRPSFAHGFSSAIHHIPSHPPGHSKLLEAFAIAHAGHYDVSRWHHHLHPRVIKECARNALPHIIGRFIHPTTAILARTSRDSLQHIREMTQTWTSRNHRKHRYVSFSPHSERQRHAETVWRKLENMGRLEYWNVSWWVAQAFTWGSVIWCINGFAAWLPFVQHRLAETLILTGWTAFVGATIFEFGSIFGILEAWNRDDTTSFGWSVKSALHHKQGEVIWGYWGNLVNSNHVDEHQVHQSRAQDSNNQISNSIVVNDEHEKNRAPDNHGARSSDSSRNDNPHHNNPFPDLENAPEENDHPSTSIPPPVQRISSEKHSILQMENVDGKHHPRHWIWFSADPRYFYELGFLAALFQLGGATVFWISGFTAISSIQEALLRRVGAWKGAFWVPQVVGGSGFIISSTFIMLESQDVWYKPKLSSLGWHVGFWNFVGGIGFTACGALGYFSLKSTGVAYQSALCTFWGSWAFLIGSVIQWYESVNAVHVPQHENAQSQ